MRFVAVILATLAGSGCLTVEPSPLDDTAIWEWERVEPAECRRRCCDQQLRCTQDLYDLYPLGPAENDPLRTAGHHRCDDEFLRCIDRCGSIP